MIVYGFQVICKTFAMDGEMESDFSVVSYI